MARSADAAVAQWFGQDIFDDENVEDVDGDMDAILQQKQQQQKKQPAAAAAAAAGAKRARQASAAAAPERGGSGDEQPPLAAAEQHQEEEEEEEDDSGSGSGSDAEEEPGTAAAKKRQRVAGGGRSGAAAMLGLSADALAGPEEEFEVVPAQESGSDASDSEDEFEAMDDVAKVGGWVLWERGGGCVGARMPEARQRPYHVRPQLAACCWPPRLLPPSPAHL